jgi:predicted CoA-binding protein
VNHDRYDDSYIRGILNTVKNVAIVGASANESRPSLFVTKYLAERGYNVFPINPGRGGELTGGLMTYAKLADVPERIDMVDAFRRSEDIPKVLDEVLALPNRPMVFWMQQGIRNDEAAARAEAAGMKVVMDRCPKIEYGRLSGEIGWVGVNSRTISSKRQQRIQGGVQRLRLNKE